MHGYDAQTKYAFESTHFENDWTVPLNILDGYNLLCLSILQGQHPKQVSLKAFLLD